VHGFVPLTAELALQRDDADRRLRLIADAYDLTRPSGPPLCRSCRGCGTWKNGSHVLNSHVL
jgi:hypothetical protein